MRPLVILNPKSGGGRTGRTAAELVPIVERALGPCEFVHTQKKGHGIELAREAATSGRELLVAVGGDGTINEVASGLLASPNRPELAVIPSGTGGDLRRTLGLPSRLDELLTRIASGKTRTLDVGEVSFGSEEPKVRRYFVNILSAGLSGLVDRYVETASRALGGTVAYFGASVRALAACRPGRLRCSFSHGGKEERESFDAYLIAICNGRYFGSGMHVAPGAKLDDGLFDVVVMGGENKIAFAVQASRIYRGTHLQSPMVAHRRCDRISVTLENPEVAGAFLPDLDGEPVGQLPLSATLVPNALTLRA